MPIAALDAIFAVTNLDVRRMRPPSCKHIGAVFEEILVAMMIRVCDDLGAPPRTIADISKYLGLPCSNVKRCLDALISEGVIVGDAAGGFTGQEDYLAARVDAEYFATVCEPIIEDADELEAHGDNRDDEKGRSRRPHLDCCASC